MKRLLQLYKNDLRIRAFALLLIAGLAIALAESFQLYWINSHYSTPSPLYVFPILFSKMAFSLVAFTFPWSWKLGMEYIRRRIVRILLTAIGFAVGYLFIQSLAEWMIDEREYQLWKGFAFTLVHSGPLILLVYGGISGILYAVGICRPIPNPRPGYPNRIYYKTKHKTRFIQVMEIVLLEANDNYVSVYSVNQRPILIRRTLRSLEQQLDPAIFQRVHRKHIVNLQTITSWEVVPSGGYSLSLLNGMQIKMSKSFSDKRSLLPQI